MSRRSIPLHVISRAFFRPLMARILLCCAVLCALLEILALLDEASTILSRHLGIAGLLKFMALHLPALIVEIMPLSVMIGALFTLLQMAISSEIAVMRAAGFSTLNMYRHLLLAPLILSIFTCILSLWVVPPCEQNLNSWWNETATRVSDKDDFHGLWFREKGRIVRIESVENAGKSLQDVAIYTVDPQTGILLKDHRFDSLISEGKTWINKGRAVQTTFADDENTAAIGEFSGEVPLTATAREIIDMTQEDVYYTPQQIWRILYREAPASLPPSHYLMAFWSAIFLPVQMAVMLLITLPVTYIPPRAGLRSPLPVYVMAAGLGAVILQGMISALGNAGSIPVWLAVSAGQVVTILFSLTWILRMEEK